MRLLPTKIASAVLALHEEGGEAHDLARNLVAFLKRKRSLKLLAATQQHLEKLLDEARGRQRVTVVSAQPLDQAIKHLVQEKAQSIFGTKGKTVELMFVEDPALIGGVRLFTEDAQYDFSLSRALKELKRQL